MVVVGTFHWKGVVIIETLSLVALRRASPVLWCLRCLCLLNFVAFQKNRVRTSSKKKIRQCLVRLVSNVSQPNSVSSLLWEVWNMFQAPAMQLAFVLVPVYVTIFTKSSGSGSVRCMDSTDGQRVSRVLAERLQPGAVALPTLRVVESVQRTELLPQLPA